MIGGDRPRILGIEVRVHPSWAIIVAAITVSVAARLEAISPGTPVASRWVVGAAVALGFLVSAIAHELAHEVVARRLGGTSGPATVTLLGPTSPALSTGRPRHEAIVALAGPLVSLAIGGIAFGLGLAAGAADGDRGGVLGTVGLIALGIGILDVALGTIQLIPAYPLDGGRVVRAAAWAATADPDRGTRTAAVVGRWVGIACALAGLVVIVAGEVTNGLMLALCGWFLVSSAQQVVRTADIERSLDGIAIGDVTDRSMPRIPGGLTLDTFADQVLAGEPSSVVVVDGEREIGVIGPRLLRRVPRSDWTRRRAAEVMAPLVTMPPVGPETSVRAVLELLHRTGLDTLPVIVDGEIDGYVTRQAVGEAIRARARRAVGNGELP